MKRHSASLYRFCPPSRASLLGLLAAALAACADPAPRELGFTQTAQDLIVAPAEPFFVGTEEFAGHWLGQAEDPLALTEDGQTPTYHFPSGSARITLDIGELDQGYATIGSISFGSGEPLPPPTDPDVGYPVGVGYDALTGYPSPGNGDSPYYYKGPDGLPPFEGFAYEVEVGGTAFADERPGLQLADGVLDLVFSSNQPLEPWCQLQTSYASAYGTTSCVPNTGGQYDSRSNGNDEMCSFYGPPDTSRCGPDGLDLVDCVDIGEPVAEFNCDKTFLCNNGYCDCEGGSCRATVSNGRLRLRRVGEELIGVFDNAVFKNERGLNVPLGEVRFRRE